jgi:hypothetical protein
MPIPIDENKQLRTSLSEPDNFSWNRSPKFDKHGTDTFISQLRREIEEENSLGIHEQQRQKNLN